jgi:dCMP deaminase
VRPSKDQYYLSIAAAVSLRATCARRKVGCVLVSVDDRIVATGYNGVARGLPHCTDFPCAGALAASGTGLDLCEAIHAEANAIAACPDIYRLSTCYVTVSPCISCVKLLLGTNVNRVVFMERYAHDEAAMRLWMSDSRRNPSWSQVLEMTGTRRVRAD